MGFKLWHCGFQKNINPVLVIYKIPDVISLNSYQARSLVIVTHDYWYDITPFHITWHLYVVIVLVLQAGAFCDFFYSAFLLYLYILI